MNIAELKGEKTPKTLAKRLLAEPSKKAKKTTSAEMEAALLRLNPQLSQIRDLKEGTPILVPDEFALAADESFTPSNSFAETLLHQAQEAVSRLRGVLKEHVARSAEETDRVQSWLKSEQAKEFVRHSPDLKEVFSGAGSAAKTLAKEQAVVLSAEDSALGKIKSQLAAFRVK
jgi:uncharacterized protein (DUF2267 family)